MKAKHILAFLSVFLITLAVTQSLVELSWKEITLTIYSVSIFLFTRSNSNHNDNTKEI